MLAQKETAAQAENISESDLRQGPFRAMWAIAASCSAASKTQGAILSAQNPGFMCLAYVKLHSAKGRREAQKTSLQAPKRTPRGRFRICFASQGPKKGAIGDFEAILGRI